MNKKALIILLALILGIAGIVLFSKEPPEIRADANDNVFGFAWAWAPRTVLSEESGLGWISFNCNNSELPAPRCAGNNDYGVNIESDGNLTGYAYYDMNDPNTPEDEVGWIDFNPSLAGRPGPPNRTARVDIDGTTCGVIGEMCGWARACAGAADVANCSGGVNPNSGGWDGWIKLRKHTSDPGPDYGVYIDASSGEFSGWAWGSNVMGWISFRNSGYKVETTFALEKAPTASDLKIDSTSYCRSTIKEGHIGVSWLYEGDDPQEEYQIQVATNPGFSSPTIDKFVSQTVDSGSRGTSGFDVVPSPLSGELEIGYNDTYWCRVKVKDNQGTWSSKWSNIITFSTPEHAYPWPDFSWSPQKVVVDEPVIMSNSSKCFDINNNETPCSSWDWTIPGDASFVDGTSATDFEPHIQFSSVGDNSVSLTVTDANGNSCSQTKPVEVRLSLIDWEEIPPY